MYLRQRPPRILNWVQHGRVPPANAVTQQKHSQIRQTSEVARERDHPQIREGEARHWLLPELAAAMQNERDRPRRAGTELTQMG